MCLNPLLSSAVVNWPALPQPNLMRKRNYVTIWLIGNEFVTDKIAQIHMNSPKCKMVANCHGSVLAVLKAIPVNQTATLLSV